MVQAPIARGGRVRTKGTLTDGDVVAVARGGQRVKSFSGPRLVRGTWYLYQIEGGLLPVVMGDGSIEDWRDRCKSVGEVKTTVYSTICTKRQNGKGEAPGVD